MGNGHAVSLHRREVVAWLTEGKPVAEIARELGVSYQAVYKWRDAHAAELAVVSAKLDRKVERHAIAHVDNRIAELQHLFDLTRKEVDDYGITVVERRIEKDGEAETIIETRDYRKDLVHEARGLLNDAAEQLGQKPKPDVHVQQNVMIIRQIRGDTDDVFVLG